MNIKNKLAALGLSSAMVLSGTYLVAPSEGKSNVAYKDVVGVWTQCYGNTYSVDRTRAKTDDECTEELAKQLLVHNAEMKKYVRVPLKDYEEAAFTSLVYNIGAKQWSKSTALRKLNERKYIEACAAMALFNKADGKVYRGLVERRKREMEVCLGNNTQAIEEARRIVSQYSAGDFEEILEGSEDY